MISSLLTVFLLVGLISRAALRANGKNEKEPGLPIYWCPRGEGSSFVFFVFLSLP